MYRKILGLCLILFPGIQVLFKALVLLFLSLFSYYFTLTSSPFISKKINIFECRSSFSMIVIVFSTLVYMVDINELIKLFCFVIMTLINILFLLFSVVQLLKILIRTYLKILKRSFPKLFQKMSKIYNIAQDIYQVLLNRAKSLNRKSTEFENSKVAKYDFKFIKQLSN